MIFPFINDLEAWVNGAATQTTIDSVNQDIHSADGITTAQIAIPCWANFPVTFPAGKDTIIRVTYTALGFGADDDDDFRWELIEGEKLSAYTEFHYILVTGAAWSGPIGSADVIFRFPYDVTDDSIYFAKDALAANHMSISGKDVTWHCEAFEPEQNVSIKLINPSVWISLLEAKKAIAANPKDGEAWGQLSKAYKEAGWGKGFFFDGPYYQESDTAYQKAISLAPNDGDWHFGYTELLCWHAVWGGRAADMPPCVQQLMETLRLRPNYPKALQALWYVSQLRSGSVPDDLALTAQPTPLTGETSTPTVTLPWITIIPSETLIPTYTQAITDTPAPTETPWPGMTVDLRRTAPALHFPLDTETETPTNTVSSPTLRMTPTPRLPATTVLASTAPIGEGSHNANGPWLPALGGLAILCGLFAFFWLRKSDSR